MAPDLSALLRLADECGHDVPQWLRDQAAEEGAVGTKRASKSRPPRVQSFAEWFEARADERARQQIEAQILAARNAEAMRRVAASLPRPRPPVE